MTETPQQLRARAERLRQIAEHAQGVNYHQEMQEAEHLIALANEIEANGGEAAPAPKKPAPKTRLDARRKKDLAKIHLLKKDAGLDDDSYRDLLERLTGKRSAGKLTGFERNKVIIYLYKHAKRQHYPNRPHNTDSNPQLQKIEALLAEAKRPWEYARSMAEKMYRKKRLEWCDSRELGGIITALIENAKKQGRRTS